jgi:hypothetical protein
MKLQLLCAALAAVFLAGCSSGPPVTLNRWQQDVDRYVQRQADGDANELRDVQAGYDRHTFASIQSDNPENSTDVVGLLLGHPTVQGKPCFVFLIAVLDHQDLTDLRLAVMSVDDDNADWHVSQPNPIALEAYRQKYMPGPAEKRKLKEWPTGNEDFKVEVAGDVITVKDTKSGANWTLTLHDKPVKETPVTAAHHDAPVHGL